MCAGCDRLEVVREIYNILGEKTVFVNAAECMTLIAIYSFSKF
jgi:pyruvate ferredoxin oxidoreductase beta subunit